MICVSADEPRGRKKMAMNSRDMMILHGMIHLNPEGMIKMSQIKDHFHVSPAAVSQGIRSFEQQGWVERVILDSDRRSVYIRVTEKGRRLMAQKEQEFCDQLSAYFRYLGEADSLALIRILERTIGYCQNLNGAILRKNAAKIKKGVFYGKDYEIS